MQRTCAVREQITFEGLRGGCVRTENARKLERKAGAKPPCLGSQREDFAFSLKRS